MNSSFEIVLVLKRFARVYRGLEAWWDRYDGVEHDDVMEADSIFWRVVDTALGVQNVGRGVLCDLFAQMDVCLEEGIDVKAYCPCTAKGWIRFMANVGLCIYDTESIIGLYYPEYSWSMIEDAINGEETD